MSDAPSLDAELERARGLSVAELADAIESIGFECTRCGACCKGYDASGGVDDAADAEGADGDADADAGTEKEPHTATVFPDEVRRLQAAASDGSDARYDWRDVARPMPYGLVEGDGGPRGETFEWALQTDACGDCVFYEERAVDDGEGSAERGVCRVHEDRPLICRTYPFSVALGGTSQPMGEAVDEAGLVRAHECAGLGRDISRADAEDLAAALKERAIRELTEAIGVRDNYEPVETDGVVVYDSEGPKRSDGAPIDPDG
ncbi:MAG: YkgJ family cysteine cluster protein [Haloquadratum sp.]